MLIGQQWVGLGWGCVLASYALRDSCLLIHMNEKPPITHNSFDLYCQELPPLPSTTTPKPGASTTSPPSTTTTTTHAPGTGFCNGKPDGLYPHPDDKASFYMCSGGNTHVGQCGAGSVFDDNCKCCNWPWAWSRGIVYYIWCQHHLLKGLKCISVSSMYTFIHLYNSGPWIHR